MIEPRKAGIGLSVMSMFCAMVGCATENVFHSVRGGGYPGYAVEYVEAVPSPGTPVTQGSKVEFKITVRYVLQSRDTGIIELLFRNERDSDVLPPGVAIPIKRERWQTVTLTQEIEIPKDTRELFVTVPVIPEGANSSTGMLRVRYPVRFPR